MSKKYLFNLQRFAEGAPAEGDAGEMTDDAGQYETPEINEEELFDYGDEATEEPEDNEEQEESFDDLIKGKYKKNFSAAVENIVKGRVKNYQENLQKANSVVSLIAQKYGIDASDPEAVQKAIMEDNSYYEREAEERGIDVETLKHIKQLEAQNARFAEDVANRQKLAQEQEAWKGIVDQAEKVKDIYPMFNLEEEMNNETFGMLIAANVPVQTAYEAIHMAEIQPMAMKAVADKTAEKVSKSVMSNKSRPQEGGVHNQPRRIKKSIDALSEAEMDEINRRVMAGETITSY